MNAPRITLPQLPDRDVADARGVTRFDVERYATGELSGAERARVEAALADDPALRAFHDDVVASDRAFLATQPPAAFLARLAEKQAPSSTSTSTSTTSTAGASLRSWWATLLRGPVLGVAAAAALVVVVVMRGPFDVQGGNDGGGDGVRTKGVVTPTLGFFVKDKDGGAHVGVDGEALRAGDQIQFVVTDPPRAAMVVVSIDGEGSPHFVLAETDEMRAQGGALGQPRALSQSLVLDDSTGTERFFVVWGDSARALQQRALEAAHHLTSGVKAGVDVATVSTLPMWDESTPQASVHIKKVR